MAIYFENQTKTTTFNVLVKLNIENLSIVDDNNNRIVGNEININLEGGKNKLYRMDSIDLTKAFKFSYSIQYRCIDHITDPKEIIQLVKTKGKKQQVTIQGN